MLETLTAESFRPHLDSEFQLQISTGPGPLEMRRLEMRMVEVNTTGTHEFKSGLAPARLPFSVIFRGPLAPALPQSIYTLEHPEMGSLSLFLVPIRRVAEGLDYEACFT